MKLIKRIEVLQGYIGRSIGLSRPAPPSWTLSFICKGEYFDVPIYNEDVKTLDTQEGVLSEIVIAASGTVLTLLNEDGETSWTVTPDTSVTSIE